VKCLRLQVIFAEANGINLTVNDPEIKLSYLYDVETEKENNEENNVKKPEMIWRGVFIKK